MHAGSDSFSCNQDEQCNSTQINTFCLFCMAVKCLYFWCSIIYSFGIILYGCQMSAFSVRILCSFGIILYGFQVTAFPMQYSVIDLVSFCMVVKSLFFSCSLIYSFGIILYVDKCAFLLQSYIQFWYHFVCWQVCFSPAVLYTILVSFCMLTSVHFSCCLIYSFVSICMLTSVHFSCSRIYSFGIILYVDKCHLSCSLLHSFGIILHVDCVHFSCSLIYSFSIILYVDKCAFLLLSYIQFWYGPFAVYKTRHFLDFLIYYWG